MLLPASHLSFQKRVLAPSPTSVIMAIERRYSTCLLTCSGKLAQGISGSDFLSQGHLTRRAIPSDLKSEIPSPPSSFVRQTLGQAIRQCPPFASLRPLHKKLLLILSMAFTAQVGNSIAMAR